MSTSSAMMQRACSFCRRRKLRCDKQLPRCQSCVRLGHKDCNYVPLKPGQHRPRVERNQVQELEDRLRRVENLLRSDRGAQQEPPAVGRERAPPPVSPVLDRKDLSENYDPRISLDSEIVRELEATYFEAIHPIMSIMHYIRFKSCQEVISESLPPLYLRYSIWAVAALRSNEHSHQSNEYYTTARNLVEATALEDPRCRQSALSRAQAWLHLAMFDMMCGRYALSWMNTSQAVRLLQIAKIHLLDAPGFVLDAVIPSPGSVAEAEEKRRAFWLAFWLDRTGFVGHGFPFLIDENDIQINLPASEDAYQSSIEEPTVSLSEATSMGESQNLSPMAAMAVIHSVCSSKIKHLQQLNTYSIQNIFTTNPLLKASNPGEQLTVAFSVPQHLLVNTENMEPSLLFLNIMAHCATIYVHRVAQKLVRSNISQLAVEFMQGSKLQCQTAAATMYEILKLANHSSLRHHHPATAYCVYHALVIFADCFIANRDAKYRMPITFLLEFMKSQATSSQVACSVFRDFEGEYPSLVIEFSSGSDPIPTGTSCERTILQPSQAAGTFQTRPTAPRNQNGDLDQDFLDGSSSIARSSVFDWSEELLWDAQAIEMTYDTNFQSSGFSMDGQSSLTQHSPRESRASGPAN